MCGCCTSLGFSLKLSFTIFQYWSVHAVLGDGLAREKSLALYLLNSYPEQIDGGPERAHRPGPFKPN